MTNHVQGLRFNHLQVTIPKGSLVEVRKSLVAFYCDTLGFGVTSVEAFGPDHLFLTTDPEGGQFIYVSEHARPMKVEGDDHLGFHVDDRAAVNGILAECKKLQAVDTRMQINELEDLLLPQTTTHAFYFRYLLPIWFDVQVIEYKAGFEPRRRWRYI